MGTTGVFDDLIKTLDEIERDLLKEAQNILKRSEDIITQLNKDQHDQGLTSEGKYINPSYSQSYEVFKKKKSIFSKRPKGIPDLNNTGSFRDGFFVTYSGTSFDIFSTDKKTSDIVGKYGSDIFGLTPDSEGKFSVEVLRVELKIWINNKLARHGLKI